MIPNNSTVTNSGLFFGTHSRMYQANKAKNQQGIGVPENRHVAQRFEDLDISEDGTFVALQYSAFRKFLYFSIGEQA